jgi:mRNA interferase YafQ
MRAVEYATAFRKDYKRLQRSPRHDLDELKAVVAMLAQGAALPERLRDHALGGNWQGCRDCHLRPDWLLIYWLSPDTLTLLRTGSHSDIFD